ncbi:MAG: phenyltransferase domain-containing protein [Thermodesulfobacteriota bacterium]
MKGKLKEKASQDIPDLAGTVRSIVSVQRSDGEIPWSPEGKTDPWDHVESAMALSVAGCFEEAAAAFAWSARTQNADGSFYASYKNGHPDERRKDPNMSSYLAVGVLHHFLVTGDQAFLSRMWPCVESAVDFAVSMQAPDGEIFWSMDDNGVVEERALLTGSCSMFLSIRCALVLASRLSLVRPQWEFAVRKLGQAIRGRSNLFDLTKSRYSMDWYYPMLSGAVTGEAAGKRFSEHWDKFVVPHWGVRCVSDRPWVTMAESSECILALTAAGRYEEAEKIFSWIRDSRDDQGGYWTGLTFPDSVIWPTERTTWTTGAVLLAADALFGWTEGRKVFSHAFWEQVRLHQKAGTRMETFAKMPDRVVPSPDAARDDRQRQTG